MTSSAIQIQLSVNASISVASLAMRIYQDNSMGVGGDEIWGAARDSIVYENFA